MTKIRLMLIRWERTVERICRVVVLLVAECKQETVSDEFNVLFHELCVDSQQWTRQTVGQESLFDSDCFGDDVLDDLFAGTFAEVAEEETGKVGVETFVSGDEFVGEGQSGHETAFLKPEDGSKRSGEEDSFDGGEGYETFCECRVLVGNPTKSPFGFGFDARNYSLVKGWLKEVILVSMASKR